MLKDTRIGVRSAKGTYTSFPQRYVDGRIYVRVANPAPTVLNLTKKYFVLIPPGLPSQLSVETKRELWEVISELENIPNPYAPAPKVVEPVEFPVNEEGKPKGVVQKTTSRTTAPKTEQPTVVSGGNDTTDGSGE